MGNDKSINTNSEKSVESLKEIKNTKTDSKKSKGSLKELNEIESDQKDKENQNGNPLEIIKLFRKSNGTSEKQGENSITNSDNSEKNSSYSFQSILSENKKGNEDQ